MASAYLQRNTTSAASSSTTATISAWVKLSNLIGNFNAGIFGTHNDSGDYSAGGNSQIGFYNGGLYAWFKDGSNTYYKQESTRRFRDHSAWYHLVYRFDLTESSSSDRIRVYVNNEEITSWATTNDPPNNVNIQIQKQDRNQRVGTYNFTGGAFNYFDGSIAHFHLCDGQSYAPTVFGETDATTGIWKPITSPSVSYGTNGFFLKFDNSANMGLDSSNNSNNLTTSGPIIQAKDTPTNVFCTMNPLDNFYQNSSFTNVNNSIGTAGSARSYNTGTLGVSTGKYYFEVKCVSSVTASNGCFIGIASTNATNNGVSSQQTLGYKQYDYGFSSSTGNINTNNSQSSYGNSYGDNDIIGVAMDLDNNKLYFHKNGTYENSGVPTSGSTGTGAVSIQAASGTVNGFYTPSVGDWWTSGFNVAFNFGNGYFGTTAVTSAQSPDDGEGIFEYDVPAGYRAICTKSINAEEYS